MRKIYSVLAWTIAGASSCRPPRSRSRSAACCNHVSEGGVVDKALLESRQAGGTGELGFLIHGHRGRHASSRCSRSRCSSCRSSSAHVGRRLWAAIAFGLVVLQVTLGLLDHRPAVPRADPRCERARHRGRAVVGCAARRGGRALAQRRARRPRRRRPMPSRRELLRCVVVGVAVTTALGAGALAWSPRCSASTR